MLKKQGRIPVSSAASRKSQKQRRAREKLWAAKQALGERQVDLVSYTRVIADMERRQLSPFGGASAIAIVTVCRNTTRTECEQLETVVADLEKAATP
jgi:hypothetical protein